MTDTLSPSARSARMRLIKSKNTQPELVLRKLIREMGYPGYRLHRSDLPGKPDIAYIGRKKAILIHGCFWHQHDCGKYKMPKSHKNYWLPKLKKNAERDKINMKKLKTSSWSVLIIWECEIKNPEKTAKKLRKFLL